MIVLIDNYDIYKELKKLSVDTGKRLRAKKMYAPNVSIWVKFHDFTKISKQVTLDNLINSDELSDYPIAAGDEVSRKIILEYYSNDELERINEDPDIYEYMSAEEIYLYTEGKKAHDIIKKPMIIQSAHSWSEYINAKCLFVSFTDVISKDLESHVLYQLLNIRGAKGLPTIAMISTSLEPYLKDVNLKEYVWNEIIDYTDKDTYDRVQHVSCYKRRFLDFEKETQADEETGIIS